MKKINAFVMGMLMVAIMVACSGCPTRIVREGMTVTTYNDDVAMTAIQPIVVESEEGGVKTRRVYYSVGLETCRELALANPTAIFIYEGPNKCTVIGGGNGSATLVFEGLWENFQTFDIWVEITPRDPVFSRIQTEKRFLLRGYKDLPNNTNWMPLKLIPGVIYNYKVTNRKGDVFDTGQVKPDFVEDDAFSQMTGEWYDFVYTTVPK